MMTSDTVTILIPPKAEYVSIARLTASGVANRIGFDYDEIEDIKVALSEVIAKIIEKDVSSCRLTIDFAPIEEGISINFRLAGEDIPDIFDCESDKFALAIISTLMDEVDLQKQDHVVISMIKKLGKAV